MIYLQLFWSFLQIGLFSIGGGYAAMPLIQAQVVQIHPWLNMSEFTDLVTIAEMTPGPIAINSATFVGIRIAGIPGALVAVVGTVLPPLIIISIISMFYVAFRSNAIVSMAMTAMLAGVAAVICDVVITLGKSIFEKKRILPVAVLAATFVAVQFFDANIILVILACGLIGAADTLIQQKKGKEQLK